ncbi:oxidoreductase [Flavobacteriales bacterium]|nr:oxidoreductase [Flavobacteriales bacterium]
MNKIIAFTFLILLLISCKEVYSPRNIDSISIIEYVVDSSSIRAIQVIDDITVCYSGSRGDIGFTEDNGVSWSKESVVYQDSIIPHFRSIATNGKDIFALSIESPALLYKMYENTIELVYSEDHTKVFYDAIQFFYDGMHGIALGDPTEDCPSVILTEDGGNSWTKLPCENLPKFEEGEAFFAASNTNIKIVDKTVWMASGGKKSSVYKSQDYGNNWVEYSTPIIQGEGSQGIYSMDFANENNGIVIGGDYSKSKNNNANKAITKDGGKTWELVSIGKNPNYKSCVQYVPNTNGQEIFAVGFTGISFSNDGGITWKEVSEEKYYTIQFKDKNTAWLSGNNKIGKLILID